MEKLFKLNVVTYSVHFIRNLTVTTVTVVHTHSVQRYIAAYKNEIKSIEILVNGRTHRTLTIDEFTDHCKEIELFQKLKQNENRV